MQSAFEHGLSVMEDVVVEGQPLVGVHLHVVQLRVGVPQVGRGRPARVPVLVVQLLVRVDVRDAVPRRETHQI